MEINSAMIPITTNNSTNVNAFRRFILKSPQTATVDNKRLCNLYKYDVKKIGCNRPVEPPTNPRLKRNSLSANGNPKGVAYYMTFVAPGIQIGGFRL